MPAEAAARFQAAAAQVPDPLTVAVDAAATRQFLEWGLAAGAPDPARRLLDHLDADWAWLEGASRAAINFGDLHVGDALSRTPPPAPGRAVLIDPIVRTGPWASDPAYCQAVSTHSDVGPVARTARWRERLGLPVGAPEDLARITTLLLGWMCVLWWNAPWRRDAPWMAHGTRCIEAAAAV
jgi:hypothetical protein